jgi:hypothetical protein
MRVVERAVQKFFEENDASSLSPSKNDAYFEQFSTIFVPEVLQRKSVCNFFSYLL